MTTELQALGRKLYERRVGATILPFKQVPGQAFPVFWNECYLNCHNWCVAFPNDHPVRGWIVASYMNGRQWRFWPHSVVEDAAGDRFEITARPIYPFLPFEGTIDEFNDLIATYGLLHLDCWSDGRVFASGEKIGQQAS